MLMLTDEDIRLKYTSRDAERYIFFFSSFIIATYWAGLGPVFM